MVRSTVGLTIAFVVALAGCTGDSEPGETFANPADFAITVDDDDFGTPIDQRAPIPSDAIAPHSVGSPQDPAAFDELLAEAERSATNGQLVITTDVEGCILLTIWAQPQSDQLLVGYDFDEGIACAEATDYRAIFVVPASGTNTRGSWNYTDGLPAVVLEAQPSTR